jgi:hypothetical protein
MTNRTISGSISRRLAERLLAHEATLRGSPDSGSPELNALALLRVCNKLRLFIGALAGSAGFHSLLSRALILAKAQAPPGLNQVHINPDGSLDGLNELHEEYSPEAGVTLIAQLLELLITFVGENLMVRLVLDACPDLTLDDTNSGETERK